MTTVVPSCRYGTGTMTRLFVDRIFQECLTYEGEVVCSWNIPKEHITPSPSLLQDYKTYLDFVLAMENRKEPQVPLLPPPCSLIIFSAPCISNPGSAVSVSSS